MNGWADMWGSSYRPKAIMKLITKPWPTMEQKKLADKVRKLLREGEMLTGKQIAAHLKEDIHDVGTLLGNMMRRGELVKVAGYRWRWKLP